MRRKVDLGFELVACGQLPPSHIPLASWVPARLMVLAPGLIPQSDEIWAHGDTWYYDLSVEQATEEVGHVRLSGGSSGVKFGDLGTSSYAKQLAPLLVQALVAAPSDALGPCRIVVVDERFDYRESGGANRRVPYGFDGTTLLDEYAE